MKFKDLLNAVGSRNDWIKLYTNWELTDDGEIIIAFPVRLTPETEVEIHYQWFWHCNPNINTSEIYNAIETHNYKIFSKWFDVLEAQLPVEYLPIDAEIRVGGEYIGSVCVAFDEQVFKLITSQDHECG